MRPVLTANPIVAATMLAIILAATVGAVGCGALTAPFDDEGPSSVRQGNEAFSNEEYAGAIEAYDSAIESMPDVAEPLYNRANALYRMGEADQSAQLMEGALPSYDEALPLADAELSAKIAFNTGNALFMQGDLPNAIESYKDALRIDPDDADAKHNLELALEMLRQEQEPQDQQDEQQEGQQQPEDQQGEQQPEGQQGDQQPGPQQGDAPPDEQEQAGDQQGDQQPEDSGGQGNPSQQGQPQVSDQPPQPAPVPPTGLTEEQARQLVESVGDNAETLQSQMRQNYGMIFSTPPERNW